MKTRFGLERVYGYSRIYNAEKTAYEKGAKEQKAIDILTRPAVSSVILDAHIKQTLTTVSIIGVILGKYSEE